jgi:hypothetical protein
VQTSKNYYDYYYYNNNNRNNNTIKRLGGSVHMTAEAGGRRQEAVSTRSAARFCAFFWV